MVHFQNIYEKREKFIINEHHRFHYFVECIVEIMKNLFPVKTYTYRNFSAHISTTKYSYVFRLFETRFRNIVLYATSRSQIISIPKMNISLRNI